MNAAKNTTGALRGFGHSQHGAALVTSLLILVVMTIIGVTAVTTSSLTEKMAGNMRDLNLAFEAAEAGLRDGERWLITYPSVGHQPPPPNAAACTTPPCSCGTPPCDVWDLNKILDVAAGVELNEQTHTWWTTQGRPYSETLANVTTQPRYIIEYIEYVPDELSADAPPTGRNYYRVTARGTGGSNVAQLYLQSVYSARY